jgi:hypothetical protein
MGGGVEVEDVCRPQKARMLCRRRLAKMKVEVKVKVGWELGRFRELMTPFRVAWHLIPGPSTSPTPHLSSQVRTAGTFELPPENWLQINRVSFDTSLNTTANRYSEDFTVFCITTMLNHNALNVSSLDSHSKHCWRCATRLRKLFHHRGGESTCTSATRTSTPQLRYQYATRFI